MWAVALWLDGLHDNRPGLLWGAGLLVAAAGLTKYFGFALVPLLAAHAAWHMRERGDAPTRWATAVLPGEALVQRLVLVSGQCN